jgi:hydroxymethylpyrimidine pyrophosphatase-like HAD family hydrolase
VRYVVFATDYDGTLAHDSIVSDNTLESLRRLRQSGRKLILVTGRELPDLETVFPHFDLFDRIVAENGALLHNPATKETRLLASALSPKLIDRLRAANLPGMRVGEVIIALWRPQETVAIEAIRDLGLETQIIFNKDAVMLLPPGVNKKSGLMAALNQLCISRHNVVSVGDAENDHAFLECSECAVAVANAIPSIKEEVDLITEGARGDGVAELIDRLIRTDLNDLRPRSTKYQIPLGKTVEGEHNTDEIGLNPFGTVALVCGQSGSGKSTLVSGLVERLIERDYQVCLVDPEGDYEDAERFRSTGSAGHAPSLDHLDKALHDTDSQVAVNLVGVPMPDRVGFFARVLALIYQHRLQTGRPHWWILDEAHHLFPTDWNAAETNLAADSGSTLLVTVHPAHVSPKILEQVNVFIVVGKNPETAFQEFCEATRRERPPLPQTELRPGEGLTWFLETGEVVHLATIPPRQTHERHKRKYAEGELEEPRVFYFRGPEKKLNLRIHNLTTFIQIARGIDDETWLFHLNNHDYSNWMRNAIKDEELAAELSKVESDPADPDSSRNQIIRAIEAKYTAAE